MWSLVSQECVVCLSLSSDHHMCIMVRTGARTQKQMKYGAEEMAEQLKTCTALAEDPSSVPSADDAVRMHRAQATALLNPCVKISLSSIKSFMSGTFFVAT